LRDAVCAPDACTQAFNWTANLRAVQRLSSHLVDSLVWLPDTGPRFGFALKQKECAVLPLTAIALTASEYARLEKLARVAAQEGDVDAMFCWPKSIVRISCRMTPATLNRSLRSGRGSHTGRVGAFVERRCNWSGQKTARPTWLGFPFYLDWEQRCSASGLETKCHTSSRGA
jgi:hypothetical protein